MASGWKLWVWLESIVESGWNLWVWLVGVVSRRQVWLVGGIYRPVHTAIVANFSTGYSGTVELFFDHAP